MKSKNKRLKYLVPVALTLLVFLAGCATTPKIITNDQNDEVAYTDISAAKLNSMIGNEEFVLIDTHIPEQQRIKGTDLFIPYNELAGNLQKLPEDKNAKIVLYCRSGSMSAKASEQLVSLGYTNVYNLIGGTNAWRESGYEFET